MNKKFFTFLTTAALLLTNATPFAATENSDEIEYFHPSDSVLTSAVVVSEDNASAYSWGNNDDLTVNVSINSDINQEISSFEITDVNGIGNESVIAQDGQSVEISGLAENELYVFESVLVSENTSSSVRGGIEIVEDEQGELVAVTDVYDFSDLETVASYDAAGIMPLSSGSVTLYYESNDTGSTYYSLHEYGIMRGIVHSQNDYDYYNFTVVNSGIVDFKLLVPEGSGMNLTMTILKNNSGTYTQVNSSANSGTSDEFCRIANATAGDVYRVRIDAVSGSSGNYYLQVENNPAKSWFPQAEGTVSSTYYWNTNNLDSLYYNNSSTQFSDNNSKGTDGMASGCSISAFAMVLANMGAKTSSTKYDFRLSNYSKEGQMQYLIGNLTPDPYIVFLANNGASGNNITYSNGIYTLHSTSYTMSAVWETIASAFGKSVSRYPSSTYYNSTVDNYTELKAELDAVDSSYFANGVIMRFSTHTVVVTKESGGYKVYDPGQTSTTFCGMNLETYLGGQSNYSYDDLLWIRVVH